MNDLPSWTMSSMSSLSPMSSTLSPSCSLSPSEYHLMDSNSPCSSYEDDLFVESKFEPQKDDTIGMNQPVYRVHNQAINEGFYAPYEAKYNGPFYSSCVHGTGVNPFISGVHHPGFIMTGGPLPPYSCTQQNNQPQVKIEPTPVVPSTLNMNPTTSLNPYRCSIFSKDFQQLSQLNRHIKNHDKKVSCTLCGNLFATMVSLNRHMKSHTGERPYECEECHKRFADKDRVKIHMRTHTGEKPFTCSQCNKSFSQKSTLKRHMLIHSGEKPFTCITCSKRFAHQGNLTTHAKIHYKKQHSVQLGQLGHMGTMGHFGHLF